MNNVGPIDGLKRAAELGGQEARPASRAVENFAETLQSAVREVDEMQKTSEQAQVDLATGEPVDLHDVLIKVEEAEIAFRTMMTVRNKLVDAYREVMRMGSGG